MVIRRTQHTTFLPDLQGLPPPPPPVHLFALLDYCLEADVGLRPLIENLYWIQFAVFADEMRRSPVVHRLDLARDVDVYPLHLL